MMPIRTKGVSERMRAENRPSADAALIFNFIRRRSRVMRARLCRTSARLPPSCCWIVTVGHLVERDPELGSNRVGHLLGDNTHRRGHRMPGPQAAHAHVDGVGK